MDTTRPQQDQQLRSAIKVPEVTAVFWVTKVLTTGMGETASDYLFGHLDPVLALAIGVAGLGQGTTFRAALALLTAASPPDRRAEVASSFFVVAYVAISAPVVGEGLAAQLVGLRTAGVGFGVAVAVLAAVATARLRSTAPPAP